MKKIFKIAAILFMGATLLSVTACSKDDDKPSTPATPVTEKSKIINRDFLMTDANMSLNGTTVVTYADLDACEKDDITKFMEDGSGIIDEGDTKCDPGDPQKSSFTWSLESNDKKLKMDFDGDLEVYDIKINNGTTLKLESTEVGDFTGNGENDKIVTSITFTKK